MNLNIKVGDEVEKAMEGFKPRFGSDEDIAILTTLGEVKNLLTLQATDKERALELKRILQRAGKRKEDIEKKQAHLLWQTEKRNRALIPTIPDLSTELTK